MKANEYLLFIFKTYIFNIEICIHMTIYFRQEIEDLFPIKKMSHKLTEKLWSL